MGNEKIVIKEKQYKTILDEIDLYDRSTVSKNINLHVKKEAKLQYVFVYLGGKRVENEINIILEGNGAEADIVGIIFGHSNNISNLKTLSFHKVANTQADIYIKGVLKESASLDYRGLIKIEKDAQKTSSYLSDHILLLSKDAKAFAIPSLEIETGDVKASHETTVGKINDGQIFYLMSRGLGRKEAEKMIVRGFLVSVLAKVEDDGINKRLQGIIEKIEV